MKMENAEGTQEGQGTPIIPGTTYKSIEDVAKALQEKDAMIARHGNEVGSLRTEKNTLLQTIEKLSQGGGQKQEPVNQQPDYGSEIASVDKAIEALDPMSDKYQSDLRQLIAKRTDIVSAIQHQKTLAAASDIFKKELSSRDARMAQQKFLDENPSFNTPDMQMRIKEYLANDKTGMHDALSAFREIERDDARTEAARIKAENEEMKKILELKAGKDSTGKVISKGQSPGNVTKPQKVTGRDLDEGMRQILSNLS
jgi:prefoldin subunit 5